MLKCFVERKGVVCAVKVRCDHVRMLCMRVRGVS